MSTAESYHREMWMSDDQWECAEMIADLCRGWHHVYNPIREHGNGIKTGMNSGQMSTYDFDLLTRAVIMAHDRCIRLGVVQSGPRMIGLTLYKRHSRTGQMNERHPTIQEAVTAYHNPNYPQPDETKEAATDAQSE